VEYSESKQVTINPDIIEYDEKGPEPLFDLVIGTETMSRLGIVLDFQTKMIMIDDAKLPMRYIRSLQTEQSRREIFKNSYFVEPPVTDTNNKRTVEILDPKYEKADLPVIVEENCQFLTSAERTQLLRVLQKCEQLTLPASPVRSYRLSFIP